MDRFIHFNGNSVYHGPASDVSQNKLVLEHVISKGQQCPKINFHHICSALSVDVPDIFMWMRVSLYLCTCWKGIYSPCVVAVTG